MRWLLIGALAGCGFAPHSAGEDAASHGNPGDAGGSAELDSGPVVPAACLSDATYTPLGGSAHTYKLTASTDFDTAFDTCSSSGAHLVAIHDPAENAAVRTANGDGWIGLDDLQTEGGFHWADATLLDYTNWN